MNIQQLGILDTTVIIPAITTMANTWSQTVIFPVITTNLSHHRTGVVINQAIINTVDSRCDRHELGPYPRAQLSIDLIYTLERLVHCTHTMEPMASHSHSGGPTAFRQNRSIAMTLSRPLRLTPHWASPACARVYQRHQRPPAWQNGHHRGKMGPNRDKEPYNNNRHTRLMSAYLIKVAHAHNLPSLEALARDMTIDLVKTFP